MRKLILIVFILTSALSFSQDKWQQMMFDKSANFFEIQADFDLYYKNVMSNSKTIPKGKGVKQFKRWEYYWESRVDKNGNFPKAGNILKEISNYAGFSNNKYTTGTGTWTELGPIAKPGNGTGQPNGNGRLTAIAFHPNEPNTLFVGAPAGGFWKSTDNGATWVKSITGMTRLGVSTIAVDPINPDTIFIGTGDRDGGDAPGYGVWKSMDGGATWAASNTGMGNRTVYEVIIDPSDRTKMIAATNGRIYRSTDSGLNWSQQYSGGENFKDIAFKPGDPNIIYAASNDFYRSIDNGVTWTQVASGVPTGTSRIAVAVSANQPTWVYLLAGDGGGLDGVYRSTNNGANFTTQATTPNLFGYDVTGGTGSQAWYDIVIASDPTDANIVYTGGVNIWKSTDAGVNWTINTHWVGSGGNPDVHADQHVMEFSPHNNDFYAGHDGGIHYTTNGGNTWTELSSGLGVAQVYKIGVSQTVANTVINGYQDNGTSIYYDGTWRTEIGGDGMECIIDPTDVNYMYGALYYGDIRRSTNGGANFVNITGGISESGAWVTPYTLDPNDANTMLVGMRNVWRTNNVKTGPTWTQISSLAGTSTIRDIAIAPSNSDVVYIARSGTSNFYRSTNATIGSPTWTDLDANLPVSGTPKDIVIDPTDPTHLFIALGNDIYESTNSGINWTNYSGTLPNISLNTIVIDAASPIEALYVGMDAGVYYRDNTMADWSLYSTNLPNVEVTELEIQYGSDCKSKLYAATYGQGLWISDLKDPGNVVPVACFEVSATSGCVGNEFLFTDNSDYSPTSWSWTFTPNTVTYINATSSTSQNPEVIFTNAGTYTVALTVTNATGSNTETKAAYIRVANGTLASGFAEDFESETLCGTTSNCSTTVCGLSGLWTNLTNGSEDNIDWRIDENGTPSGGTGPSVDYNPGSSIGNYAYLEASGGCNNATAIIESDCIIVDQAYDFIIGYHMFGGSIGSLHVDIYNSGVWQEDVIPSVSGNQGDSWNDLTVDLSSYIGKTIKLRVRGITGNGWSSDIAIDDLRFTVMGCSANVWNGSTWSTGSAPTLSSSVEIAGNYNTLTHGSFECCSLLINSTRTVEIEDSNFIVIQNGVTNNGTLTVKNNGSLIQVNENSLNTGTLNYERTANIRAQDYVYWSSPIQGFDVDDISPLTPSNYIFKWDPTVGNTNGGQGSWVNSPSEIMLAATGYIVRGPSNFNTTLQNFTAQFTNGKPNNGVISTSISRGNYTGVDYQGTNSATITRFDDNWNLVGNPYPSAINVLDFLNLNSSLIEGSVSIWTHDNPPNSSNPNPFYGNYSTNYSPSDYIIHNGTGTVSGPNGFNGFIAGGQGFLVLMNDGPTGSGNLVFNNTLRHKSYVNNQFYRTTNSESEKSRIWLNLANENQLSERTLIAYLEEATNLKDRLYDAYTKVDFGLPKIYTFMDSDKMVIQAFALPFTEDDLIPLGVNIPSDGTYTISIHAVEGLFSSQQIYLEDLLLNIITDISLQPYEFFSEANEINNRFVLRFNQSTLSNTEFENELNNISIHLNESNQIDVISKNENLKNIVVFDLLGRQLFNEDNINANTYTIKSIKKSDSILLMKITLDNNHVVYRKILF